MGFFSWDCKCCGESLKSGNDWMSQAVVVADDGSVVKGEYDGYGRVDGRLGETDITEADGCCAVYHAACYKLAGKPDYDGPSHSANDQGLGVSEIEPKTLADIDAIKARRQVRNAEAKAAFQAARAKMIAEYKEKGEAVPTWLGGEDV
jgi:hypothetical protein